MVRIDCVQRREAIGRDRQVRTDLEGGARVGLQNDGFDADVLQGECGGAPGRAAAYDQGA
jgi:hypothetical protein